MERKKLTLDDCSDVAVEEIDQESITKEDSIDIEEINLANEYDRINKELDDYIATKFNNPESDAYNDNTKLSEFAAKKKEEIDELDKRKALLKELKEELKISIDNMCLRWETYATITYGSWLSEYQSKINDWNKKYANQFIPCHESVLEMSRIKSSTKQEIIRCNDQSTLLACIQEHIDTCKQQIKKEKDLDNENKIKKFKELLDSFDLNHYLELLESVSKN